MMRNTKSILFLTPDYHCSFIYREELRKLGWKADIYVSDSYQEQFLYSSDDIIREPGTGEVPIASKGLKLLWRLWFIIYASLRYKYHFCYGGLDQLPFCEKQLGVGKLFGESFRIYLFLAKLLNCKFIHNPSGCMEQETKLNFSKFDDGNVCNNCGWSDEICNDKINIASFDILRRYADMMVDNGNYNSSQYPSTHIKYKSLNLDLWSPKLEIPKKYQLPYTKNLRILHSFVENNRIHGEKNIKGSPFVYDAINQLKSEGYHVEYLFLRNIPSRHMRYYQAQADIVVEQLIYGWWGSTGVETMALGKPVVCYIRKSWKELFFKTFHEYNELPIVEANTDNIYEVLKRLIIDDEYRNEMANKSCIFAESHFDIKKNAPALADIFLRMK